MFFESMIGFISSAAESRRTFHASSVFGQLLLVPEVILTVLPVASTQTLVSSIDLAL